MKRTLAVLALAAALSAGALAAVAQTTPEPTPGCANSLPTRLIVRERGRVSSSDPLPINVRAEPTTASEEIGQLEVGMMFYVLSGPRCSTTYTWYRMRARINGEMLEGWIAEGDRSDYYVERFPPGL